MPQFIIQSDAMGIKASHGCSFLRSLQLAAEIQGPVSTLPFDS